MARVSSGAPASGTGMEMDVVTAVVIGGVSINGGKGKISGAFIGALIIGVLSNGLTIMNIGEYYQQVVKGVVLILAVAFDAISNTDRVKGESCIRRGRKAYENNTLLWGFQYIWAEIRSAHPVSQG